MPRLNYFQKLPVLFITVLIFAGFILAINIEKPFIGHHDWNSVVYSQVARNYLRYGVWQTKFGQVNNFDVSQSKNFGYITHYPPLLPLLMAGSFWMFGISEASARLVPIIASILMVALIYWLGIRLYNANVGFLAGLFASLTPLYIYFGKLPVHETVVPAFSLIAFCGYFLFLKNQTFKNYLIVVFGIVAGGLINWTGYYVVPPIIFHYLFFSQKKSWRKPIAGLALICVFLFVLHLIHLKILTGNFVGGGLIPIFLDRFNPYRTKDTYGFSFIKYLYQEFQYLKIYLTASVCLLAGLWFGKFVYDVFKKRVSQSSYFLLQLFMYGMIQLILFQQLVFIHDYMIYYLLPFMVLSGAVIADLLLQRVRISSLRYFVMIVLILIVAGERAAFAKALLNSDMNRRGEEIGNFIAIHTSSGEKTLVGSFSYKEFTDVFIGFYADRNVSYIESPMPDDLSMYRLIVRPKDHDAFDAPTKQFLDNSSYSRYENDAYIWYDTKHL